MSISDFQSIMLPLLTATGIGKQCQLTVIREELAQSNYLSPEEGLELIPSRMQPVFDNSVASAKHTWSKRDYWMLPEGVEKSFRATCTPIY